MKRSAHALILACVAFSARPTLQVPAQDSGAAGTWQRLLKLRTTASLMHTTAHPDDEHGGMLALASRGEGARVSLLTLNRGESGDNAIGAELFDGLGLIRTEELLVANRYYGVDRQYFTTVIDYGFSKRLEEAFEKWGRDAVLRDVVRVIRMERPFVLVARFQGNERDGHGNHQTAGLITQLAWKAAGDPNMFPEQIKEGLRPWQPFKLYMGGVRENEDWTVKVDAGEYSPALGDSFSNFARYGLSFQRSQTSGRFNAQAGPSPGYYRLLQSRLPNPRSTSGPQSTGSSTTSVAKEQSFFDGLDTRLASLPALLGRPAPAGAPLDVIDAEIDAAFKAFTIENPAAVVPALARGLRSTRRAIEAAQAEPEIAFVLRAKEQQFMDAINTALGMHLTAVAQPSGVQDPAGPFAAFAPPPAMGPVVAGQVFDVRAVLTNRSRTPVTAPQIALDSRGGFQITGDAPERSALNYNESATRRFNVTVAADAPLSKPYFSRDSIRESRYEIDDLTQLHRPASQPALTAMARYTVEGANVEIRQIVQNREAQLPYGYAMRELKVVPVLAVTVRPRQAIVPLATSAKSVPVRVELLNNKEGTVAGALTLRLPAGWTSDPPQAPFTFSRAGEKRQYQFTVAVPALEDRDYQIEAIATADGREYREGYDVIEKRDLETRLLYHPAAVGVRGIDVKVAPGLRVGYVMGIGDDVPGGIAQLGATVTLLGEQDLASGDLRQFDAIMTGTRAYAVRDDLRTYNQRLLDYARDGGNLIVLYNTQELDPNRYAPLPGELTQRAEEVSEEDSPVEILAPDHPVFRAPNTITKADFSGWVEQRGSKFWASWDKGYTPLIATWDKGQKPQPGGWLHTRHGKGHYTYFAYAFHRQLPYGVPGAYRLLANLLSMGKTAGS
jgi:LmbE family N-acetylglucosaminyl deacetylase